MFMSLQLEWVGLKKKVLSFQFDEPASFIKETHKTNGGGEKNWRDFSLSFVRPQHQIMTMAEVVTQSHAV